jgi:hypothetical protein
MCCHKRLFVGLLPQILLLSMYCHRHWLFIAFMCCHKDSLLVYCHKSYYFPYTATDTWLFIAFHVLPQRLFVVLLPQILLLSIYCHKHLTLLRFMCYQKCWLHYFLYTATNPVTFHILPQTLYFSLLFRCCHKDFVVVLPQILSLSIYCHRHLTVYCFSCAVTKTVCCFTATNPVTFHILPQTLDCLLLFMCCHKDCLLFYCHKSYHFPYTATDTWLFIAFHVLPEMQTLLLSIYCHKCCYFPYCHKFWLFVSFHIQQQMVTFVLGGYTVHVTRFALKLKLRGAQRMGTIVYCVAPGTYHPLICCLHHHHQNHQHLLKVQVIRVDILEGSMTLWIEASTGCSKLSLNWKQCSVEGCLCQKI